LEGGEICVLPGKYVENVTIDSRQNITIKGCGRRSHVVSPPGAGGNPAAPVFHVIGSQNIKIQSLFVEADDSGVGVLLEGGVTWDRAYCWPARPAGRDHAESLLVSAATQSAIEVGLGYEVTFVAAASR